MMYWDPANENRCAGHLTSKCKIITGQISAHTCHECVSDQHGSLHAYQKCDCCLQLFFFFSRIFAAKVAEMARCLKGKATSKLNGLAFVLCSFNRTLKLQI